MYNENVLSITPYERTCKDGENLCTALSVTENAMNNYTDRTDSDSVPRSAKWYPSYPMYLGRMMLMPLTSA